MTNGTTVIFSIITKTRLFKYIENFTTKNWKFSDKKSDMFYISAQNIDCGYPLEPPRRGGSNEYLQSMFFSRNKKNNVYSCEPQFNYIKLGLRGSKLYRHVFCDRTRYTPYGSHISLTNWWSNGLWCCFQGSFLLESIYSNLKLSIVRCSNVKYPTMWQKRAMFYMRTCILLRYIAGIFNSSQAYAQRPEESNPFTLSGLLHHNSVNRSVSNGR